MRRGEGGKHLRTRGRWMRPSERIVFLILLERSDNTTCSVPSFMTPSLTQLADAARYSNSATAEALTHLERHGWVTGARGGGRGRKSGYQLADGHECQAGSPATCLRPPKQSDGISEGGMSKGNWPVTRIPGVRGLVPEDGATRR